MADIGLNQNFSTDSRDFHIQTATLVDEGLIRAEVFEKGRLLFVENYQYERRNFNQDVGPDSRLRKIVDQVHQSMIEEIDSLFEISEQIFGEKNATAHEKIGLVFLYMHVFDKAESHLQASIEINKNYYGSYIHLARAYFLQKRYNKAYELLSEITGKNFHYPDMYNLLGMINLEKKKHSQAFQYFKQALKYNNAYIEAYFNLIEAILQRMVSLKGEKKEQEIKKRISFLKILLKKIDNFGNAEDRKQSSLLNRVLNKLAIKKALKLVHDYRETNYIRHMPPEIIGYKFYLRLFYSDEEMSAESLNSYEEKISAALQKNPSYPDLWHYLALIHLMQCRHFFLKGLENFRDATRINPNFEKAAKNLRLVENDGREFLALINNII